MYHDKAQWRRRFEADSGYNIQRLCLIAEYLGYRLWEKYVQVALEGLEEIASLLVIGM